MTKVADDRFDVHGDDGLVLDDQDLGASLRLDLAKRFFHQGLDIGRVQTDQIGDVIDRETFQRRQQQRLSGERRQPREPCLCNRFLPVIPRQDRAIFQMGGRPDRVESPVKAKPRIDIGRKLFGRRDDRFQRRTNIGVTMALAARQGAGIAAQERKMGVQLLSKRHL